MREGPSRSRALLISSGSRPPAIRPSAAPKILLSACGRLIPGGPSSKYLMSIRRSTFLRTTLCLVFVICSTNAAFAQRELAGAEEAKLALDRLNVCATVLMIAAHPDDENTAILAYLARGRLVDTGYLSLTRGEGGQNL